MWRDIFKDAVIPSKIPCILTGLWKWSIGVVNGSGLCLVRISTDTSFSNDRYKFVPVVHVWYKLVPTLRFRDGGTNCTSCPCLVQISTDTSFSKSRYKFVPVVYVWYKLVPGLSFSNSMNTWYKLVPDSRFRVSGTNLYQAVQISTDGSFSNSRYNSFKDPKVTLCSFKDPKVTLCSFKDPKVTLCLFVLKVYIYIYIVILIKIS
jgi:hypothetical protein